MTLVPPYIKNLKNYVPGKSIDSVKNELGLKNIYKLASNENPNGPSKKALNAIRNSLESIHRYPDPSGLELRNKLAQKFNLNIDNIVLGSGSEGIMSTIMRTFLNKGDEIITAKNSFIGFKVLANASGKKIHWVPMKNHRYDLKHMLEFVNKNTKIIYIANPDNPMGTFVKQLEFEKFYSEIPKRVLIILDEAYFEYSKDLKNYPDSMNYRYDNIITLRTFSKIYGLAGLRVGYGFAHSNLIGNIMKVKEPFTPSLLGINAAIAALDDDAFLKKSVKKNKIELKTLKDKLNKMEIKNIPSATNFITSIWPSTKIAKRINDLLLKKGIIVRHLAPFGWPKYVRFSIGNKHENKALIDNLEIVIKEV